MTTDFDKRAFCPDCEKQFEADRKYCPEDGALLLTYDVVEFARSDPLVGSVLDERFRIEEPLSEGGMGKVYRGSQMGVDRDVAIKIVTSEMSEGDEQVRRFFREAQTLSNFTHPNIVNFIDFGQDSERRALYLVMELIEGCALDSLLAEGRLEVDLAVEVVLQLCAALSDPHDYGFVHRDLKPANVMLLPLSDGSLQVKLVDFGIAGAVERGTKVTKTGKVIGTPEYMAPEQAEDSEMTPASDIYSVGTLVYHMLSGRPMFEAESDLNLIFKHLRDTPPKLSDLEHSGELPPRFFEVFPKLVAKHPGERPDSVLEVRRDFMEIARSSQISEIVVDPDRPVEKSLEEYLVPVEREEGTGDDEDAHNLHTGARIEEEAPGGDSAPEEDSEFDERTQVGFGPTVSDAGDDGEAEPGPQTVPTPGGSSDGGPEFPLQGDSRPPEPSDEAESPEVASGRTETGPESAVEDDEETEGALESNSRMTAEIRSPSPPEEASAADESREATAGDPSGSGATRFWVVMASVVLIAASAGVWTAQYVEPPAALEAMTGDEVAAAGSEDEEEPADDGPPGSAAEQDESEEEGDVEKPREAEPETPVGGASQLPDPYCPEGRDSCSVPRAVYRMPPPLEAESDEPEESAGPVESDEPDGAGGKAAERGSAPVADQGESGPSTSEPQPETDPTSAGAAAGAERGDPPTRRAAAPEGGSEESNSDEEPEDEEERRAEAPSNKESPGAGSESPDASSTDAGP